MCHTNHEIMKRYREVLCFGDIKGGMHMPKTKKQNDHIISAVHVTNRVKQASRVQSILTQYGGCIKTRIGLHEASQTKASSNGLILIEFIGTKRRNDNMLSALNGISGVEAKSLVFCHD